MLRRRGASTERNTELSTSSRVWRPGIPSLFAALLEGCSVVEAMRKELAFPAGNGMKLAAKEQVGGALTAPVP
jgi:hypothetical protein